MDIFLTGAGVASWDRGGGLTYVKHDLHYVYGIFSNGTKLKDDKSLTVFTNVSSTEVLHWLYNAKHALDEEHPEK